MTTNGLLLGYKVKQLRDAGLESVNISLDTFKQDRFKAISGNVAPAPFTMISPWEYTLFI
jgi:cyclic pyranopterin phosphate synthase